MRSTTVRRSKRSGSLRPALSAITVLLLTGSVACSPSTTTPNPPEPPAQITWRLAVLAPLTGPSAASGRGALESVRRAVADSASDLAAEGIALEVVAFDDRGQQSVGQQQATLIADDPAVVAVVGSTEGSVDEGVQPILRQAGLVTISLGGAEPLLTRRGTQTPRAFPDYLTLSAQRLDRARVAAALRPTSDLSATTVHGPRVEDLSMSTTFARDYVRRGGPPPNVLEFSPDLDDPASSAAATVALRASLRATAPRLIYVAADATTTWGAVRIIRDVLPTSGVIVDEDVLGEVPDDIASEADTQSGSSSSWGPLWATASGATPASIPPSALPTAPPESSDPSATDTADEVDPDAASADEDVERSRFSVQGHDAAVAISAALSRSWPAPSASTESTETPVPDGDAIVAASSQELRALIARDVRTARHQGLLGAYRFDTSGVSTRRLVGVYRWVANEWVEGRPREVVGTCRVAGCAVRLV